MRVCLVYDCLFPHTVGGAERWYANLAERLVRDGHDVTYITLRQWERGERPRIDPRVRVLSVGPRMALYTASGRRRILPPLLFGAGALLHLLAHGRRYEVVDTCSFPYFSLLAAAAARPLGGYVLVVDWFEVWSAGYWQSYLGALGGRIGALVQRLCAALPQRALCFSELHAARLREQGLRGEPTVLRGLYAGSAAAGVPTRPPSPTPGGAEAGAPGPSQPVVLFAARLIPEKQVTLAVAAIALAAQGIAGLRGEILGEGPERGALEQAIREHGLQGVVRALGFAAPERVEAEMERAMCMLVTSRREGYGMVVVEAAAHGTPSVVVAGEDNAATELIREGVNGTIAERADADAVAAAIARVHAGGAALRQSTAAWFAEHAQSLSLESSLQRVLELYAGDGGTPSARA